MYTCARTAGELKYCNSLGVFNKTIIPLALVGYEIVIANSALCASLLSTIAYPMHVHGIILKYTRYLSGFFKLLSDGFNPAEIIDGIRQLYRRREGWLAPFPWCEEFHFELDDIFTRLRVVSRMKTTGRATADIVNMSGIFKPREECPQPRKVLIEGKPGIGKTVYCKKLAYDWATGKQETEDCFPAFKMVLLLRCCDIKSDLWEAIDDQLLPEDIKEDERGRFHNFIHDNQSNVVVILDGLDEAPPSILPVFSEIMQDRLLPACHLVATARPEAGVKVRMLCDTLLEIEGFTEEDARKFIVKYFRTREDLAQNVLHELENDKNLRNMAANPLNTALLCLICEEFGNVFPKSRTRLYMGMVECILRRYLQKKTLSVVDPMEAYKIQLKHLGWVALNGLRKDEWDFEKTELGRYAADIPEFGFLSAHLGGSKLRPFPKYGFLHKSVQEFFAAFYLYCQLLNEEISVASLAADRRYLRELKGVLLFTFGMLAANCEETAVELLKGITTQVNHEDDDDCFCVILECIKECEKDGNFHLKLAHVSGSFLQRQTVALHSEISGTDVVLSEVLKWNKSLTKLNLCCKSIGHHAIACLADGLKCNRSLTELDLSGNNIDNRGATGLAEALGSNSSLTKLDFCDNNIGDYGVVGLAQALRCNTSLTNLYLSGNSMGDSGIAYLADAIECNTSLTELKLSGNTIGDHGAAGLAKALRCNRSLKSLHLSRNSIGDHGITSLADAIECNSSLTELELSDNNIGDHGAGGLAKALRCNGSLKNLHLSRNSIGNHGVTCLADAIKYNVSLTTLELSDNNIGDHGAASLATALRCNRSLTNLHLSRGGISDHGTACLADVLKGNTNLTELDLSGNNIGRHGASRVAQALRCNARLTKLHLSCSSIGDRSTTCLSDALSCNASLTELDLSDNNIGHRGAAGLAEALRCNTSLTKLHLSRNNIGDHGTACLGDVLICNTSLTQLDLSDNKIGDHGAAGLAKALRRNRSLESLHLSRNSIGDHGITCLADAIKCNSSLTELELSDNNIGHLGAAGLAEALRCNTSLTKLHLSRNKIGDHGTFCLADALKCNTRLTELDLSGNSTGHLASLPEEL